jgi:hypothetical protein
VSALVTELVEELLMLSWTDRRDRPRPLTRDAEAVFDEELHLRALTQIGQEVACVVPDP